MCARVLDSIMSKMGMHFLEPHVEMVNVWKARPLSKNEAICRVLKDGTKVNVSEDSDIVRVQRNAKLNEKLYKKLNLTKKRTPAT